MPQSIASRTPKNKKKKTNLDPETDFDSEIPGPKSHPYELFMRQVTLRSPVPIANWFGPRLWLGYLADGPMAIGVGGFLTPAIVNLRLGLSPRLSGSLSPQRPIRHLSFWWCMCPKCHVVAFNQIFTSHWELSDLESHLYMAVRFTSSTFCYFSILHIVF